MATGESVDRKYGFLFSPVTIERLDRVAKYLECSRTMVLERLIRAAAESLDRKEGIKVQECVELDALK